MSRQYLSGLVAIFLFISTPCLSSSPCPDALLKPPGPSALWAVGPLLLDRLGMSVSIQKRFGEIATIPFFGLRTSYEVFHPDLIQEVLVTQADKFSKGRSFEKAAAYFGNGLATSEGARWRNDRRLINPFFKPDAVEAYVPSMALAVQSLTARWHLAKQKGQPVKLSIEFPQLAMEAVARSLFGAEVDDETVRVLLPAFRVIVDQTMIQIANPIDISPSSWLNRVLPTRRKFTKANQTIQDVLGRMIQQERGRAPSSTLLSNLVHKTEGALTDRDIYDQVVTLFLGGTDTTGNTLQWVFYHLAKYPDLQAKARQEIQEVLGGRTATAHDLPKLEFITRFIQETLRLYPQNWLMSRDTLVPVELGGYRIAENQTVFLSIYQAHRRADFWPDPLRFDPDRFLPEAMKKQHKFAYLPFGGGMRKCIGFGFALTEMKLVVATILQQFEFEITNLDKVKPLPRWSLAARPSPLLLPKDRTAP